MWATNPWVIVELQSQAPENPSIHVALLNQWILKVKSLAYGRIITHLTIPENNE